MEKQKKKGLVYIIIGIILIVIGQVLFHSCACGTPGNYTCMVITKVSETETETGIVTKCYWKEYKIGEESYLSSGYFNGIPGVWQLGDTLTNKHTSKSIPTYEGFTREDVKLIKEYLEYIDEQDSKTEEASLEKLKSDDWYESL